MVACIEAVDAAVAGGFLLSEDGVDPGAVAAAWQYPD